MLPYHGQMVCSNIPSAVEELLEVAGAESTSSVAEQKLATHAKAICIASLSRCVAPPPQLITSVRWWRSWSCGKPSLASQQPTLQRQCGRGTILKRHPLICEIQLVDVDTVTLCKSSISTIATSWSSNV